jgi:BTB/POZ domain-containing protein 1/2
LSPECLRLVIESDDLKCKEEIIYQKIIEWSTNRCQVQNLTANDENIRQVLGDLLYLIRFPIMERTYFTEDVSKKSLLTSDEIVKVYQSLDDDKIDVFPTKCRNIEHMVCRRCDSSNLGDWYHNGANDFLDFTTNLDCIMLGIDVFGSSTYSGKHDMNLTILNSSGVLRNIETVLYSEEGKKIYPVMLEKSLLVKKNTRYTIKLNMTGPNAFTGKSYKKIVPLNELSVTFLSSSVLSPNSTREDLGQIPGIIIYKK